MDRDIHEPRMMILGIMGNYVAALRAATESSLVGLNSAVNWALTLTIAVFAIAGNVIYGGSATPLLGPDNDTRFIFIHLIIAAALAAHIHFGIRTIKSYINVIRFAAIERGCLNILLKTGAQITPQDEKELSELISEYHMGWKSPLSKAQMLRKLLFEFGFLYHYIVSFAAFGTISAHLLTRHPFWVVSTFSVMLIAVFLDVRAFENSAYGRQIQVNFRAQRLG